MEQRSKYLIGKTINPPPVAPHLSTVALIEEHLLAYNGARLQEACRLFTQKMLEDEVTIGLSITGALTPAGLGRSCIVPLIKAGFVDWIVTTGANLYHDIHFALGLELYRGTPFVDDRDLAAEQVVRIYDILMDYEVLVTTDAYLRRVLSADEFQKEMGSAELHYRLGKHVAEKEAAAGLADVSVLAAAHAYDVPIYTPSAGDSSIGMNIAAFTLEGNKLKIDVTRDVNETTAIVWQAIEGGGKNGVVVLGGGAPKNFLLQTQPHLHEILGVKKQGHDYFIQITDARPDTGGLSGATPKEAVSWGKINPAMVPHVVVVYCDVTIALPLITAYTMTTHAVRSPKRLYKQRSEFLKALEKVYLKKVKSKSGTPYLEKTLKNNL